MCVPHVCVPAVHNSQRRVLDPLELDLQSVGSHVMWVLGLKPFARVTGNLNSWATSPSPQLLPRLAFQDLLCLLLGISYQCSPPPQATFAYIVCAYVFHGMFVQNRGQFWGTCFISLCGFQELNLEGRPSGLVTGAFTINQSLWIWFTLFKPTFDIFFLFLSHCLTD